MPSPVLYIDGIPCTINMGSDGTSDGVAESWPETGPIADVVYYCVWEERYDLARALMGSAAIVGGVLVRTPAHRFMAGDKRYCKSLGVIRPWEPYILQTAGFNGPAGWLAAKYAIIPAHYEIPPYDMEDGDPTDPSGQPWTTTRFRLSGDVFTPPNGVFYYVDKPGVMGYPQGSSAGVPVHDSLLGIVRPQIEISMTRHKVPASFPIREIVELIGTTNSEVVRYGNYEFPKGHLLLGGFNSSKQTNTFGVSEQEIEYGLLGRHDHSWNEIMAPDSEWYLVNSVNDESGIYPFKYSDFALIP